MTGTDLSEAARASIAETLQHMDVVAAKLHSELDRVLQLLKALNFKFDRLREDFREGFSGGWPCDE